MVMQPTLKTGWTADSFLYKLIIFDPNTNMYEHIVSKMGEAVRDFRRMRDAVYDSLDYNLKRAERHEAYSQKVYTSPSFMYEIWR